MKDYVFPIIINSALYLDKEFHTIDHLLYQFHLGVAKTVGVGNVKHTVNNWQCQHHLHKAMSDC